MRELEAEVAALRAWKANLEALPSMTSSASEWGQHSVDGSAMPSLLPPLVSIEATTTQAKGSLEGYITMSQGDSCASMSRCISTPERPIQSSPAQIHPVRGFTAATLEEAEAAEEMQHGELEVKVADASRSCSEAAGACTVVQVRTIDRPGLLAQLSSVLGGMDLRIARAFFRTSDAGVVSNEFWVQTMGADGRLGPILEGVKRRAIEQRIRQWSAGQRLELRAQHLACGPAACDLGELLKLHGWDGAAELSPHALDDDDPFGAGVAPPHEALIGALTNALVTECSWLGALPPVLARPTATRGRLP